MEPRPLLSSAPAHSTARSPRPAAPPRASTPLDQQAVALDAQHAALDLAGGAGRAAFGPVATGALLHQQRSERHQSAGSTCLRTIQACFPT